MIEVSGGNVGGCVGDMYIGSAADGVLGMLFFTDKRTKPVYLKYDVYHEHRKLVLQNCFPSILD